MLLSIRAAGDVVNEPAIQPPPIPSLSVRTSALLVGLVPGTTPNTAAIAIRTDGLTVSLTAAPPFAGSGIGILTGPVRLTGNAAGVRVVTTDLQVRLTPEQRGGSVNVVTGGLQVSLISAGQPGLGFTRDMVVAGQPELAGATLTQPVLLGITLTDPGFRSADNGGRIQQTNAADLEFVAIGSGQTLPHNLISHDDANGTIIFDLQLPLWTPANDFQVRINYGGAASGTPGDVWYDLPIRSGRLSASGTSFWYERSGPHIPPLTALAAEEADVAPIDAMAASSAAADRGNVSTWDRLIGGPVGSPLGTGDDTQFDWRPATDFGFGYCVTWLPTGAAFPDGSGWLFWVMQTVPNERRVTLDDSAIWQEIIDGDHDDKYIAFGERLAAKIDQTGHPRSRFILDANHEMNQTNDYRVFADTLDLYKRAMERTIDMIRAGADFRVRFCHRPGFAPEPGDPQPGIYNSYIPNNVDVLALSMHPGADVTSQALVDALIDGTLNPDYYGITNNLLPTAQALGLPIAFPEFSPKFDQTGLMACPVADLFMTTFFNRVVVPNRAQLVCDCVWNQNIRDPDAYEGPGATADAQWRAMVDNRKTLWRAP